MTIEQAPVRTVYALEPDVRIRPLPEWAGALVYTPHSPDLHYLNTTACCCSPRPPSTGRRWSGT